MQIPADLQLEPQVRTLQSGPNPKSEPSQAKRGDLLFWGPGGSQHEAIYLGGGKMIEAQQTGVPIKISPVRTAGMTPYVIRIIET